MFIVFLFQQLDGILTCSVLQYYVNLISKGTFQGRDSPGLPNSFPQNNLALNSPYGPIWFEWPQHLAKGKIWEDAVQHEMIILCNLVLSGWTKVDQQRQSNPLEALRRRLSVVSMGHELPVDASPAPRNIWKDNVQDASPSVMRQVNRSMAEIYATPSRRALEPPRRRFVSFSGSGPDPIAEESGSPVLPAHLATRGARGAAFGHRNTRSSPIRLPSTQP